MIVCVNISKMCVKWWKECMQFQTSERNKWDFYHLMKKTLKDILKQEKKEKKETY